jgi:hypothetical protein
MMRLQPLYRVRFAAPEATFVTINGPRGTHMQLFAVLEGRCEGRITGRFHGTNHPQSRADGVFQPDVQGIIETDDGATLFFDHQGYGRPYPAGRRQIVGTFRHLTSDERYSWLNDVICVATGEVREAAPPPAASETQFVIDVAELIWEALDE